MNREDDPQLWDLLSHSKVAEASPFFARNVLRAIRQESQPRNPIASWFELRRLIPSFSALAAVLVAAFTLHTLHNQQSAGGRETIASADVPDSELAADLDVLSSDDDSDDAPLL